MLGRTVLRTRLDRGGAAMMALIKSVLPTLLCTGLFVAGVYLVKYIIHRVLDHK
jgi:hypothetical protein